MTTVRVFATIAIRGTGDNNTAIGNTTGDNNTAIGGRPALRLHDRRGGGGVVIYLAG